MCEGGRHSANGRTIVTNVKLCALLPVCRRKARVHWGVAAAGYYLRWNAGVSCRTSSQIWGRWNLLRFLLRYGSLTLMNIASLMILAVLCTSLPTMEKCAHWCTVLKCCHVCIWGRGPWDVPLHLSPKVLPDSSMYSSSQSSLAHLNLQITPHFWVI